MRLRLFAACRYERSMMLHPLVAACCCCRCWLAERRLRCRRTDWHLFEVSNGVRQQLSGRGEGGGNRLHTALGRHDEEGKDKRADGDVSHRLPSGASPKKRSSKFGCISCTHEKRYDHGNRCAGMTLNYSFWWCRPHCGTMFIDVVAGPNALDKRGVEGKKGKKRAAVADLTTQSTAPLSASRAAPQ